MNVDNDEVVADSEDEHDLPQAGMYARQNQGLTDPGAQQTAISYSDRLRRRSVRSLEARSNSAQAKITCAPGGSSIVTERTDSEACSSGVVSKVRPRPRPRPRPGAPEAQPNTSINGTITSTSATIVAAPVSSVSADSLDPGGDMNVEEDEFFSAYSSAIAERIKTRLRGTKTPVIPTTPSPAKSSHKAAHRDKRQSTSKRSMPSEVIDITSDEDDDDELALISPSSRKSKTRRPSKVDPVLVPKPVKRNKVSHESQTHPSAKSRITISLPPSPLPTNAQLHSDPPSSTVRDVSDRIFDLSPITVLSNDPDASGEMDTNATSPPGSPLFSPTIVRVRKKRAGRLQSCVDDGDGADEIESETRLNVAERTRAMLPPPPPPFFASSSDSAVEPFTCPSASSEAAPSAKAPKKKTQSSSKTRKRKNVSDDEEYGEKSEAPPKRKAGPKNKPSRKARNGENRLNQVEVVIQKSPDKTSRSTINKTAEPDTSVTTESLPGAGTTNPAATSMTTPSVPHPIVKKARPSGRKGKERAIEEPLGSYDRVDDEDVSHEVTVKVSFKPVDYDHQSVTFLTGKYSSYCRIRQHSSPRTSLLH
jgi:hypothetical protein